MKAACPSTLLEATTPGVTATDKQQGRHGFSNSHHTLCLKKTDTVLQCLHDHDCSKHVLMPEMPQVTCPGRALYLAKNKTFEGESPDNLRTLDRLTQLSNLLAIPPHQHPAVVYLNSMGIRSEMT